MAGTCSAPTCTRPLPKRRRTYCSDECARWGGREPRACEAPACENVVPIGRRRFCSDLCYIRGRKVERVVEAGDFGRGAIRMIQAMARRLGASDIAEFGLMWQIMAEAEAATVESITRLRSGTPGQRGFSWADLAAEVGTSRQAVAQWHGRRVPARTAAELAGVTAGQEGGPLALTQDGRNTSLTLDGTGGGPGGNGQVGAPGAATGGGAGRNVALTRGAS